MAEIQFGNSFCQLEGLYVPVADVTTMPLAGMPLIMDAGGRFGQIAFSRAAPSEMMALPLQPGQQVDVREHLFMIATHSVKYDWFSTDIWFTTKEGDDNETETHYPIGMFMDRFSTPQTPGLLLLHAAGNVFVRELAPNQTILIKPTSLIFKDPTVQMRLHFEHPQTYFSGWGSWGNRYLWLRLWGPGRVAVQSVFEHIEGESRNMQSHSSATVQRW